MEQTSFYLIADTTEQGAQLFACRLLQKVYGLNQSSYVLMGNEQQALAFDQMLWTFQAESFIPHRCIKPLEIDTTTAANHHEIIITWINTGKESLQNIPKRDFILNLSNQALPDHFEHCTRLSTICCNNEQDVAKLRHEYKRLQSTGITPEIHDLRGQNKRK